MSAVLFWAVFALLGLLGLALLVLSLFGRWRFDVPPRPDVSRPVFGPWETYRRRKR